MNEKLTWAGILGGVLVALWLVFQAAVGIYEMVQSQRRASVVVSWYEQVVAPQILRQQALEQAKAEAQAKAKPTPAAQESSGRE